MAARRFMSRRVNGSLPLCMYTHICTYIYKHAASEESTGVEHQRVSCKPCVAESVLALVPTSDSGCELPVRLLVREGDSHTAAATTNQAPESSRAILYNPETESPQSVTSILNTSVTPSNMCEKQPHGGGDLAVRTAVVASKRSYQWHGSMLGRSRDDQVGLDLQSTSALVKRCHNWTHFGWIECSPPPTPELMPPSDIVVTGILKT